MVGGLGGPVERAWFGIAHSIYAATTTASWIKTRERMYVGDLIGLAKGWGRQDYDGGDTCRRIRASRGAGHAH